MAGLVNAPDPSPHERGYCHRCLLLGREFGSRIQGIIFNETDQLIENFNLD